MDERNQDVELIDYLRVLWRQKWVIVITFVAAVAAAWGASRNITPTYRSDASMLLLPTYASELEAESPGSRLEPNAYKMLATSTDVLRAIVEGVGLPESTGIGELRNRLNVSLDSLLITEDRSASVSDQVVLNFSVTWHDRQAAVDIATVWLAAVERTFGEVFLERTSHSSGYLQQNLDQTVAELLSVIEERAGLLAEFPLDAMRSDVDALLRRYAEDVSRLYSVPNELEVSRAHLAGLETEIAKREPTHALQRTLAPDSLVMGLAAGLSTRDYEALLGLEAQEEAVNETYVSLDTTIATERAQVGALEAEQALLQESVGAVRNELVAKQAAVLEVETALEQFDTRIAALRASRTKLAAKLLDAKLAQADEVVPVRVINEPLAPARLIAPNKTTNIAIAGFASLFLGTLFAFFVDYLARVRERERAATPSIPTTERSSIEARREEADEEPQSGRTEYREDGPPAQDHGPKHTAGP